MLVVLSILLGLSLIITAILIVYYSRALSYERRARRDAEQEASQAKVTTARLESQLKAAQDAEKQLRDDIDSRFRSIASEILLQSTETLSRRSAQGLADALAPMKENFEQFRQSFVRHSEQDTAERTAMAQRVKDLMELNHTIGQETRRLTDALKGNNRVQGQWGEMILSSILEHCGLRRGYEYDIQQSVAGADGMRLRPDVVINYTDGRKIVVDSKVSISAYFKMLEADNDEYRRSFGQQHVQSVRRHIAELKDKSYHELVGTAKVDFVLMFIPHEGAYMAAMQLADDLWETAYAANVLIVSPTHLMGVLRLVEQMWRHERQERNAMEIARQAGLMLDKLRGFLEDMDRIDKALNDARGSWNEAFLKLSSGAGNLLSRAAKLESLGVKSKKPLPKRYVVDNDDDSTLTQSDDNERQ